MLLMSIYTMTLFLLWTSSISCVTEANIVRNIQSLSRERIAETFGNHSVKDKKIEKAFDEAMSVIEMF